MQIQGPYVKFMWYTLYVKAGKKPLPHKKTCNFWHPIQIKKCSQENVSFLVDKQVSERAGRFMNSKSTPCSCDGIFTQKSNDEESDTYNEITCARWS